MDHIRIPAVVRLAIVVDSEHAQSAASLCFTMPYTEEVIIIAPITIHLHMIHCYWGCTEHLAWSILLTLDL